MELSLNMLQKGQVGYVGGMNLSKAMSRRLQDFGMIEGTKVECLGKAPAGSPILYRVRGTVIGLRLQDCKNIQVVPLWD